VNVVLKYNEKVKYTHKSGLYEPAQPYAYTPMQEVDKPGKTSFWVALGLDLLGAAIISAGYLKNVDAQEAYDEYKKIGPNGYYGNAWDEVESNRNSRNMLYAIGGVVLASGIGVHIWF